MAKFFIHRPVFAIVISLIILIAGGIGIFVLPIAQYPQISPPTVEVEINYPGANSETVEQSIATNVEAEVNGAENMIYMSSKSSSDGRYVLTCTFKVGHQPGHGERRHQQPRQQGHRQAAAGSHQRTVFRSRRSRRISCWPFRFILRTAPSTIPSFPTTPPSIWWIPSRASRASVPR